MIEVSVILVTRNEERYIVECIRSVEEQFINNNNWELIVVDGKSEDRTVNLCEEYLNTNADYPFRIFDNPGKILATGWNIGIQAANGKYIIRPDAHAILYPDYIKFGVKTLEERKEAGVVGGILKTLSRGFWGDIIKVALSSKIGVGNSSFRTGAKSGYKDTAVYGLYRKEVFDDAGLFNENLIRHQDTEFHARVQKKNWKFWLNENMMAGYYCRDSLSSLAKQMYNIGLHLPALIKGNMVIGIRARHLMPFFFFTLFFLGIILGTVFKVFLYLAFAQIIIYFTVLLFYSIIEVFSGNRVSIKYLLLAPVIFTMHFSYFLGTLTGFLNKIFIKV
ncbi:MAG: hypothetical protein B6D61_05150 [Bacteroidetes bacterium 4484_249]|nr:MAG: hypothetical protein B6D61_05150 [Bacteroidetes bacterium 4484_249]